MRFRFSLMVIGITCLLACRGDDQDVQTIDQVLRLYVKNNAGQDMLNSKIKGSYTSVNLLDLLSETALVNVSGASLMKDSDTITYLDYAAGATRLKKDSLSPNLKTYFSKFIIRYTSTVNSLPVTDDDTIQIDYTWTPSRFELSTLKYNGVVKFTKVEGQPNIVTIVK